MGELLREDGIPVLNKKSNSRELLFVFLQRLEGG